MAPLWIAVLYGVVQQDGDKLPQGALIPFPQQGRGAFPGKALPALFRGGKKGGGSFPHRLGQVEEAGLQGRLFV